MNEIKKKILVIEDDEMISSMYKTKFEDNGYIVFTANNGVEGLEIAKRERPDIIMLDIILPQLDGFSVLKELKENSETKEVPVVMLTNLGTEEDKEKGDRLGAAGYLVKANLTPAEVSKEIKKYLK